MGEWIGLIGALSGVAAISSVAWGIIKDRRSGALRKGQAEATKAAMDATQAEQSLPHLQESLKLGNLSEAISIQQQVINGLREHATWQDEQLEIRDGRIAELDQRLRDRDAKVAELEERLEAAEEALTVARRIITDLRLTSASEESRD